MTKAYRSFWGRRKILALDKLYIDIRKGEIFGLLGPNGSGKTTTLKLLLGLIFPTEGRAYVLGKTTNDVAIKSKIGFLPEESCFYRFLNADETLDFYGQLFRIPGKERKSRINRLVEQVGLEFARKRPLRQYSKGMLRRMGIAQALINDPDLVILDEPTSGVDPNARRVFWDLIYDLAESGVTIIVTTHYMDEAEYCNRVGMMRDGKLLAMDSPGNLKANTIPGTVWEVRVESLQEGLEKLPSIDGVERVGLTGDYLRVITAQGLDNEKFKSQVQALISGEVKSSVGEATLEDVFLALASDRN